MWNKHFMKKRQKWKPSSFQSLIVSQSLGALNDNTFKLLIIFHVISILGTHSAQVVTSVAGMCFVLPFILFSAVAGWLADRYSKRSLLVITKLLEILIVLLGISAVLIHNPFFSYIVIACMGLQSTFFSPGKYGIIPELMPKDKVSWANGWLSFTTYAGVIIGTFCGSLLTDLTGSNFVWVAIFCLSISIIGSVFIFGVDKTPVEFPGKPFPKWAFLEPFGTLKITNKYRHLTLMIFTSVLFLFVGSFAQINILAFTVTHLGLDATDGGYIFLLSAFGIGAGSMLAGRMSKGIIELGIVPFAIGLIGIGSILSYFFASNLYAVLASMFFLGLMGGFLIVPVEAFIQIISPKERLGQILACANFFNFIGILIASSIIYFLHTYIHMTPAQNFLAIGILLILLSLIYFKVLKHFVRRFCLIMISYLEEELIIVGSEKLREENKFLIFSDHAQRKTVARITKELRQFDFYIISSVNQLEKHANKLRSRSNSLLLTLDPKDLNLDAWEGYECFALDLYPSIPAHQTRDCIVEEYPASMQLRNIKKPPKEDL